MIPSAVAADDKTSPANADDATSAEATDARIDNVLAAFFEDESLRSSLKAAAAGLVGQRHPNRPLCQCSQAKQAQFWHSQLIP